MLSDSPILIVDDEVLNLRLMKAILEDQGWSEVSCASSPLEALELMGAEAAEGRELHFDLVLLDVMMPEMDGFTLCRMIKEMDPGLPVVMITGLSATEDHIHAIEVGADDIFTKPTQAHKLLARVNFLLNARREYRRQQTELRSLQRRQQNLPPLHKLRAGDLFAQYRLREVIGDGRSCSVFQATHPVYGEVAVKILHERMRSQLSTLQAIRQEWNLLLRAGHPHVMKLLDHGINQGYPFLVLEMCAGLPQHWPAASLSLRLSWASQLCQAVAHIHAQGIVHRELTVDNLYLSGDSLKLGGFGIGLDRRSCLSPLLAVHGSPAYLPPEAMLSAPDTPAADVYALGVVLYRLLCGRLPFMAPSAAELVHQHCFDEPADPCTLQHDLPAEWGGFLLACLGKRPEDRPPASAAPSQSV